MLKAKIMRYIKEPKGVDFIIQSKPLAAKERKEISKFIEDYKTKNTDKKSERKSRTSSSKPKSLA